ncbi:MAG: AhpC/TSA family protein [Actinobacteria bacterium]|nr:MAG: AhpC/TSA family protein [Actinomycetota bacterium]
MIPKPAVGDPAPEATLLDRTGASVALSSTWQGHPAVLVFLRYFGCPFCQMQVVGLRADRERFEERTATVVLIGDEKQVSFECVLDTEGWVYSDYGLGRGSLGQVFGPASIAPFLRANLHAETRQRGLKGGSMMQMPGTFVVDSHGVVRFAHRNRTISDSPRNEHILEVLGGLDPVAAGSDGRRTSVANGTPGAVGPGDEPRRVAPRAP